MNSEIKPLLLNRPAAARLLGVPMTVLERMVEEGARAVR
jgi:hypothetical protein